MVDGTVGLFKTALIQLPQADSLYVGYDNGCWLQVRRLDNCREAPPKAVYIWSFARFVPMDIVKGIIDVAMSTSLGGSRRELTILFSDVRTYRDCRDS